MSLKLVRSEVRRGGGTLNLTPKEMTLLGNQVMSLNETTANCKYIIK